MTAVDEKRSPNLYIWDPEKWGYYGRIPIGVKMTINEKLVFWELCVKGGTTLLAWGVSIEDLARLTELTPAAVRWALEGLKKKGLLDWEKWLYIGKDGSTSNAPPTYILYPRCHDYTEKDLAIRTRGRHVRSKDTGIKRLPPSTFKAKPKSPEPTQYRKRKYDPELILAAWEAFDKDEDWKYPEIGAMCGRQKGDPTNWGFDDPRIPVPA